MTKLYIQWPQRRCRIGRRWVPVAGRDEVREYADQAEGYAVYLALPRGVRAAFRGAGDNRPVYPWDYVDRP